MYLEAEETQLGAPAPPLGQLRGGGGGVGGLEGHCCQLCDLSATHPWVLLFKQTLIKLQH